MQQQQQQLIVALKARLFDANEVAANQSAILNQIAEIVGEKDLQPLIEKLERAFPKEAAAKPSRRKTKEE